MAADDDEFTIGLGLVSRPSPSGCLTLAVQ
jgi:hypothetical protein